MHAVTPSNSQSVFRYRGPADKHAVTLSTQQGDRSKAGRAQNLAQLAGKLHTESLCRSSKP
jgi:hypothetical protein